MQPSIPPFLAVTSGVIAAMFFIGPFGHWLALAHASWVKHGGAFLGPAKRRPIPSAALGLFHPVPYLFISLIVVSVLTLLGFLAKGWWWFLGGFYLYVAAVGLFVWLWHAPHAAGEPDNHGKRLWPLDVLARRRYDRQYRAVCGLLLVQASFAKLSIAQQANVITQVRALLLFMGTNVYLVRPNNLVLTFIFAAQMQALGITPALEAERWPLPDQFVLPVLKLNSLGGIPRRLSLLLWRGIFLSNIYHRGGKLVEDAKAAMNARGLNVDANGSAIWAEWAGGRLPISG
jgi:hypothetical protein